MRFNLKMTLKKKVYLLLALGLAIGIGAFSYLGVRAVNQATEAMLEGRMTTAQLIAGYLDSALGQALSELENTSRAICDNFTESNARTEVQELENIFGRASIYTFAIYIVDESGKVIWSQPESAGMDIAYYPTVNQVLKGGLSNISNLVLEPKANIPAILLASPIQENRLQTVKGAVVAAIDISRSGIASFIRPIQLMRSGYVEIVDQNGVVVTRTDAGPALSPFETSDHSTRFAALIAAGKPTRGLCHTCHQPIQKVERKDILAFVPLSITSWGVVVRQPETEALTPVFQLRQNLILSGSLFTFIASLIVIVTMRDIINRIQILSAASKRIAGGDLDTSITQTRQDEIGMLAGTFENMRVKLKSYYNEIEQSTSELSYLLSISEMLSHLSDLFNLDTALGSVLERTLAIIREPAGGILLVDEEKKRLFRQVNRGLYRENTAGEYPDQGIGSRVVSTGEVITYKDISENPGLAESEALVEGLRGFISIPLRSKTRILGVLNIGSFEIREFSVQKTRLLEGIAGQIAVAIENARLHREVQRKEEIRGELLQDMFSIQEEERKRIARELHDETSQVISGLNASLEATSRLLKESDSKPKALLKKAQELSINILDEIHKLIYELRPSLLDDMGLVAAVRWLAQVNLEKLGMAVDFQLIGKEKRLPPKIEVTLFRVIQEALTNIARHSRAKNVSIHLQFKRYAILIRVKDDGRGFDVDEAISTKNRPRGLGLLGMKERVSIVKGAINIKSHPGGRGTEITIEIPFSRKEVSDGKN